MMHFSDIIKLVFVAISMTRGAANTAAEPSFAEDGTKRTLGRRNAPSTLNPTNKPTRRRRYGTNAHVNARISVPCGALSYT
jgi:hypothetical protein